jgi:hypothetical protein
MGISMNSKKEIIHSKQRKYQKADKKGKMQIITAVVSITGWTRDHTARCLRGSKEPQAIRRGRGRKPKYGMPHKNVLRDVWHLMDFACSRRLQAGMKDILEALAANDHLSLDATFKREMEQMSHGTMDRLLRHDRESLVGHGRSTTKPGSLLKYQIPIRRGSDWNDSRVGFLEIDLVAHCGSSTRGEFVLTLDATDIKSGWTECRAVINRAQIHTFHAMKVIRERLPFSLLGIDSDNGTEFINDHFLHYCRLEDLVFTRGRPNTSNDSCHIEQKNWSVVRQTIGYSRFEGQQAVTLLNEMYEHLRLLNNFFMPSAKLLSKTRDGSRISKIHDKPLTPYRRLIASPDLSAEEKTILKDTFRQLDPLFLRQQIQQLSRQLQSLAVPYE